MPVVINGSTGISGTDGSAGTPAVQGTDTNTGIYFPGADRIGFAEGGVQVGEFDASSNFRFNSGYGSVAIAYGCRAWVSFNGTGTVAIRASGNVTSITDNGVGLYTVNFSSSMPDVSFAYSHSYSAEVNGQHGVGFIAGITTSSLQVAHYNAANSGQTMDKEFVLIAIFR
jgi:hypothetical protein